MALHAVDKKTWFFLSRDLSNSEDYPLNPPHPRDMSVDAIDVLALDLELST